MSARLMRSGAAPMTGALKIVDGTVGAPAVQFANGSSTGIYKTTAGIGFSIGGTQVAELVPAGFKTGARFVGELIPYTGTTAPNSLTVLAFGQTLNRLDYPTLWVLAQAEITAGNLFYNNGNGTTTFGIGDLRGRVVAGADAMGGVAASRLTAAGFGGAASLGATGGAETATLITANLPPYTPSGSIANGSININGGSVFGGTLQGNVGSGADFNVPRGFVNLAATQGTSVFSGNAQGGTSTPVKVIQPTQVVNFLLFAGA